MGNWAQRASIRAGEAFSMVGMVWEGHRRSSKVVNGSELCFDVLPSSPPLSELTKSWTMAETSFVGALLSRVSYTNNQVRDKETQVETTTGAVAGRAEDVTWMQIWSIGTMSTGALGVSPERLTMTGYPFIFCSVRVIVLYRRLNFSSDGRTRHDAVCDTNKQNLRSATISATLSRP